MTFSSYKKTVIIMNILLLTATILVGNQIFANSQYESVVSRINYSYPERYLPIGLVGNNMPKGIKSSEPKKVFGSTKPDVTAHIWISPQNEGSKELIDRVMAEIAADYSDNVAFSLHVDSVSDPYTAKIAECSAIEGNYTDDLRPILFGSSHDLKLFEDVYSDCLKTSEIQRIVEITKDNEVMSGITEFPTVIFVPQFTREGYSIKISGIYDTAIYKQALDEVLHQKVTAVK